MRVKCLAQEHKIVCPASAQTQTAPSEMEYTNPDANALPQVWKDTYFVSMFLDFWLLD